MAVVSLSPRLDESNAEAHDIEYFAGSQEKKYHLFMTSWGRKDRGVHMVRPALYE